MWALARAVVRSSSSSFLTMPYTSTRTTRCTQSRRETMLLQFPPYPWNRTITIHRCARNLASSPPRSTTTTATTTTKATTPTVTRKSTTTAAAVGFATVVTSVMAMAALAWPESDTIGTDASTTRVGITIPTATSTATATPDNVRLQFQLPLRLGSNDAPANVHTSNLHEEGRSVDSDLDSNLDSSSPYSFPFYDLLLQQLEVVIYVEGRNAATITSDSGRNKPSGLVGLACLHCIGVGGATLRTLPPDASIFPQDRRSLARDVSTKMYHHVSNCHNFPGPIREHLRELRREHNNNTKQQERERAQAKVKHTANQPSRSSTTPRKHPFVSQEERLFFKDLWYQMGHK